MSPGTEDAWLQIRALRARRPGYTGQKKDRARVFSTALEQAEQLFRGAEVLGAASRPLNIYYGLTQAGRALSAAFEDDPGLWRVNGHGLGHRGLDIDLSRIEITADHKPDASFSSICRLARSAHFPRSVKLLAIVAAIPECRVAPAPWTEEPFLGPIELNPTWLDSSSESLFVGFPGVLKLMQRRVYLHMYPDDEGLVERNLRAYPQLAGCRFLGTVEGVLDIAEIPVDRGLSEAQLDFTQDLQHYDQRLWAFPVFPGASRPVDPLVPWWSTMYGLSMLARYVPDRWGRLLDVDVDPHAVPLERLLSEALRVLPALLIGIFKDLDWRYMARMRGVEP